MLRQGFEANGRKACNFGSPLWKSGFENRHTKLWRKSTIEKEEKLATL